MPQYSPLVELSSLDGNNGFEFGGEEEFARTGRSVSFAGDVNGDGFGDIIIGAYGTDPLGSSYVLFGAAGDFAATMRPSDLDGSNGFTIEAEADGDGTGRAVSSAGDVNGDGYDDMIVGATGAGVEGDTPGACYIVFGSDSGVGTDIQLADLDGTNGFKVEGDAHYDNFGWSVSGGDINGDGFDDIVVGANNSDVTEDRAGSTYVIFGKASGFGTLHVSNLDGDNGFRIDGEGDDAFSGSEVSTADVNGDGFADILIGAYEADANGDASGASYVVFGKSSGFDADIAVADLDGANGFSIVGAAEGDRVGMALSSAGDVNADGYEDIVVGSRDVDPAGAAYVVFGTASAFDAILVLDSLDGANGFRIDAEFSTTSFGVAVSSAGDVNGDGFDDMVVGASHFGYASTGRSYVVFGKAAGFGAAFDAADLDGNNGFKIDGEFQAGLSGREVSGAGDMNGDGFDDLIIGAPSARVDGQAFAGAIHVVFGGKPGEAVTRDGTAIDNTIHGGDFNDTLRGLDGADALIGHGGSDRIEGGKGNDVLRGGGGGDALYGGGGADRMIGGDGRDLLSGDGGADVFKFFGDIGEARRTDSIRGFDSTEDRIDLSYEITAVEETIVGQGDIEDLASELGAFHAVLVVKETPPARPPADAGAAASKVYLVIDFNGDTGFQKGEDILLRLRNPADIDHLDVGDFF